MTRRRRWHVRLTRDLVLFASGLGAFWYEVLLGGANPEVLTFCLAVLLSPAVVRGDELGIWRRRDRRDRDDRR